MDGSVVAAGAPPSEYHCPDETHPIDRAVHLGRLAAFYPACRHCVHRHDRALLSPDELRHWDEVEAHGHDEPSFTAETFASRSPHGIDRDVARRFVAGLGTMLWRGANSSASPRVIVGSDGHWSTAELVAVVCEALQWFGCGALEAGAVTSPALVAAAVDAQADAAIYVGNSDGSWHEIGMQAWGPGGAPWSSPGTLDELATSYAAPADRCKRRGGGVERVDALENYLAPLAQLFHGLRPLRFVLDTRCEALVRYFERLNGTSACELVRPGRSSCVSDATKDRDDPFVAGRLAVVARELRERNADLGLWIDGQGAACRLVDEQGHIVDRGRLCAMLASYVCRQRPAPTLVVDQRASKALVQTLVRLGARIVHGGSTRQSMSETLRSSAADFGASGEGEFWYPNQTIAPDALLTLSLLLTCLSESDRPLSEVLDAV